MEIKQFPYEMWNDSEKKLALYYGAATSESQKMPARVTRILDSEGKLLLEYNNVNFMANPQDVLDDCKLLFGNKASGK